MKRDRIREIAEEKWESCGSCDENDKNFWINGFMIGYLNGKIDKINEVVEKLQDELGEKVIDGINCEYSGLPAVKAYENK